MAKVHQQIAAKDYPEQGIIKGDTYYKWTLRSSKYGKGTTYKSKTYPTPRQLTRNAFRLAIYDLEDQQAAIEVESLEEGRDALAEAIRELSAEEQEKLDNMPEGLQQGSTGELLQERVDGLDAWADEVGGVEIPGEPDGERPEEEPEEEEGDARELWDAWSAYNDELASALEEIQNTSFNG